MISWQDLGAAIALLLILEGLMPFLNPDRLRKTLELISQTEDGQLRFMGLILIVLGTVILYFVRFQ